MAKMMVSEGASGDRGDADFFKRGRWCLLLWPSLCSRRRIKRKGAGGDAKRGSVMTESKAKTKAQDGSANCGRAVVLQGSHGFRKKVSGELPLPEEIDGLIKEGLSASGAAQHCRQLRLSPGRLSPVVNAIFDPAMPTAAAVAGYFTHSKINGGLLQNGSASPPADKIKSSSSLLEMMSQEPELQKYMQQGSASLSLPQQLQGIVSQTKQLSLQERVNLILAESSSENQFNDPASSDMRLTLTGKDAFSVSVFVHRHILTSHSRFFAARLSDHWSKQHRAHPQLVEISDCDNVELYLKTVRLMYCRDLKRALMKETVLRVLEILKIAASIVFEAGVASCLDYLEAMPWAEDDEEKVVAIISQLQLESTMAAAQVLKRLSVTEDASDTENVLVRLLHSVTQSTDEKARREMKSLVSRLLRENLAYIKELVDASKGSLYLACNNCLDSLVQLFKQVTNCGSEVQDRGSLATQINREADNLHWLIDILIQFRVADEFVRIWAHQSELASLHSHLPTMYRYGVSRLTARLCVGIGKGSIFVPKEERHLLLQTWLQPLVDDFGWMQRCCKAVDRNEVEEGISQTILTLPMKQQQSMLLAWFDKFSSSGDDCPNLHKAFEVWWRRTFVRPCLDDGVATAR